MRLDVTTGTVTSGRSFAVTRVKAARHGGHDGGDARLVPADAGVEDRRAGRLDLLGQGDDLLPRLPVGHEVEHREAVDDDEVGPGCLADGADDLDGQSAPVLRGAAPRVGAPVGAWREELVEQVALRAHDLDAVVAGLSGQAGAAGVRVDGAPDAARGQGAGREGGDRRLERRRRHGERVVGVAAGVQDLERDRAALAVYGVRDDPVAAGLPARDEDGATRVERPGEVGREAARDDEADAAAGSLGVVGREPVEVLGAVLEAGVHRAHDHAVAQRGEAEVEGFEQVRVCRRHPPEGSRWLPSGSRSRGLRHSG